MSERLQVPDQLGSHCETMSHTQTHTRGGGREKEGDRERQTDGEKDKACSCKILAAAQAECRCWRITDRKSPNPFLERKCLWNAPFSHVHSHFSLDQILKLCTKMKTHGHLIQSNLKQQLKAFIIHRVPLPWILHNIVISQKPCPQHFAVLHPCFLLWFKWTELYRLPTPSDLARSQQEPGASIPWV